MNRSIMSAVVMSLLATTACALSSEAPAESTESARTAHDDGIRYGSVRGDSCSTAQGASGTVEQLCDPATWTLTPGANENGQICVGGDAGDQGYSRCPQDCLVSAQTAGDGGGLEHHCATLALVRYVDSTTAE